MGAGVRNRWITGRHGLGEPRARLVCLPQSGAGAGAFAAWRKHLPEGLELAPVELPGRGTRIAEPMPVGVDALAEALFDGLSEEFDLPYVVFGHSLGGLLAYEVARRVQEAGLRQPLAVLVSGARAPYVPPLRHNSDVDDSELIGWLTANGGLPEELFEYPSFLAEVLRVVRADLRYAEDYLLPDAPALSVPLHVFGGTEDEVTPPVELPRWERCAGGEFTVSMLPGGHSFPHRNPAEVLAVVRRVVDGAAGGGASADAGLSGVSGASAGSSVSGVGS